MAKQNNQRWYALMQKTIDGKELSKEEAEYFFKNLPKLDDARFQELAKKLETEKLLPQGEASELLTIMAQKAAVANKDAYFDNAEEISKTNLGNKISGVLNTAIAAGDIVASAQQISKSRNLARQSRRPSRPAPLTADPLLSQAIVEAQQGKFDAARRLAPAQLAILDQYMSDINQARTASTGQAGTYGALAQVASTRRGRGAQQLAPMMDDIIARQDERKDNLLRLKLNENQAIQQSQAQFYPTELEQYRAEQAAIANLGAQGRENLRQGIANFGSQIVDPIAQAATKRRFDRLRATMGQYPEAADIRIKAETDLNNTYNGVPPMLEQAYPSTYDSGYFSGRY